MLRIAFFVGHHAAVDTLIKISLTPNCMPYSKQFGFMYKKLEVCKLHSDSAVLDLGGRLRAGGWSVLLDGNEMYVRNRLENKQVASI